MPAVASIKGSIFSRAVEDLRKLVTEGEVSRDELERRLRPSDLAYLDQPLQLSGWYDVKAYGRMLELLRDVAGGGKNEYLRARGVESAEALLEAGLYQQMEYLDRTKLAAATDPEERFKAFGRDLKLLISMFKSILSFSVPTVKVDPDHPSRYLIEISEAEDYPEALAWTTDGFINRMAQQHGTADLWTWRRPRRYLLVFHMTREV